MGTFIRAIVSGVVEFWSQIYSYNASRKIKLWRNRLYTMWIRRAFGSLPGSSNISFPCSLLGDGGKNIFIGENSSIQGHGVLGCWMKYRNAKGIQYFSPSIIIGNNCSIGEYSQITAIKKITIGDGLLTGRYVFIGDNSHGSLSWEESTIPPCQRQLESKGEIVIGNNVWIGDKVTILGGVTIGNNVIIGANSVVTHNIPSNSIAIGAPARVVKELEPRE